MPLPEDKDRSKYYQVSDTFLLKFISLIVVLFLVILTLSFFYKIDLLFHTINLLIFGGLLYIFTKRRCNTCKNKMKRVIDKDGNVIYFCNECRKKIILLLRYGYEG